MRQINILNSNNKILVDDEDGLRVNCNNWTLSSNGKNIRQTSHKMRNITNFIMKNYKVVFDHMDRNLFNCQKNNLRIANRFQNASNRGKPLRQNGTTSAYKGVFWYPRYNKWASQIRVKNKKIHLGYFNNELKAAIAYNEAADWYHKEFAVLNIIPEVLLKV